MKSMAEDRRQIDSAVRDEQFPEVGDEQSGDEQFSEVRDEKFSDEQFTKVGDE